MTIALQESVAIKGLVLISSGARLRVMDEVLDSTLFDFETTAELVAESLWSERAPEELKSLGKRTFLANQPEVVYADYLACNCFDIMDQLCHIELPTLVICGSEDKMTPLKYSRYLADQIPNASLKVVEGAGHMLPLEKPEIVASHINQFLKKLPK